MGFDDIQSAKLTYPALTTIKQDIAEKAKVAANLLLNDLRNHVSGSKKINIDPVLVIRDSVKKI